MAQRGREDQTLVLYRVDEPPAPLHATRAQLVIESGWSEAAYRAWVTTAVERLILQD